MVSSTAYAAIAIAVVVPLAIFAVYSTTIEPEPAAPADVDPVAEEPKLSVLASFYPIGQFVSGVGGDKIELALVMPPGAEPHDWEPTVRDVQNMRDADVIVINGIGFETWVEDLEGVGFDGILVDTSRGIELMDAVEGAFDHHEEEEEDHGDEREEDAKDEDHGEEDAKDEDHGEEDAKDEDHGEDEREEDAKDEDHGEDEREEDAKDEDHGEDEREEDAKDEDHEEEEEHHDELLGDPHIWLNPVHVQVQVRHIADGLSEADPANADYYQANADAYIAELQQLDSDIRTGLESCSNEFIAFHQAFTYFSAEYGLVQHTILKAATPHGEVAPRTLEAVIETAREQGITTIFTEESADPRTSQVVADEIGGQVLTLSPLEIGQPGETYISTMYKNLDNLKVALCQDQ